MKKIFHVVLPDGRHAILSIPKLHVEWLINRLDAHGLRPLNLYTLHDDLQNAHAPFGSEKNPIHITQEFIDDCKWMLGPHLKDNQWLIT